MSAASPVQERQSIRPTTVAFGARSVHPAAPVISIPGAAEAGADDFRLNLADVPRLGTDLQIDGFSPSLFSRLLDLFGRLRGR